MNGDGGLRERKKQRTRRAIAQTAMQLFLRDGFDRVTIARIAAASEVSEKTVYNYFPSKGEIFFDESVEILDGLLQAIRDRKGGESALAALRRFFTELSARVGSVRPPGPSPVFRQMIDQSQALRSARREMFGRFETALAALLAEETASTAGAVEPFVAAAALVAVFRARFESRPNEADLETLRADLEDRTRRALDLLEHGLGAYAVR